MKIQFNLLPQQQKKHLQTQKMFRTIMEQEIQIFILCLILLVSLFGIHYLLKSEVAILEEIKVQITEQESYKKIIEIHKTFKKVRTEMNSFSKLTEEHIRWSQMLIDFSEVIPETIVINSVNTNDNTIKMDAVADTREDVVDLKEQLREFKKEDINCFTNVVVPESQLTIPADVKFTVTFDVNVACLR